MDITWKVLSNNNNLRIIAREIVKCHLERNDEERRIKSLEIQREKLLKASQNLIKAVELGIITEQTRIRLKELEMQIAECDVAIEQEKQKNLSYLTEDMIMDYFKKVICGDINNYEIKKQIVKTFIREIIVYNDLIVILYNFTTPRYAEDVLPDDVSKFNLVELRKYLIDKEEVNKNMDITVFYSKEYFAVIEKRNKNLSL